MERKISKSNKGSKTRLKKEDEKENSDSKNSKKKIIHRWFLFLCSLDK